MADDSTEERFASLWTDYLEGDLDEAGMAELQALLAADERLAQRAANLFESHRLLGFALQETPASGESFVQAAMARLPRTEEEFVGLVMQELPTRPFPARRSVVRTLTALAAGLLLGVTVTSVAWAYSRPSEPRPEEVTLLNEGFESGPAPRVLGMPIEPEVWSGDFSRVIGKLSEVAPAGGGKMLQILRADYENKPTPEGSYTGDLFRIVDLRLHRQTLAAGEARVQVSASFNAATFPKEEQYGCSVAIHAVTAEMVGSSVPLSGPVLTTNSLAMARQSRQRLDRDPRSWQRIECELRLPPETDFLVLHLGVAHVPKFQKRITFDGHFLDDVKLTLTHRGPQP